MMTNDTKPASKVDTEANYLEHQARLFSALAKLAKERAEVVKQRLVVKKGKPLPFYDEYEK